MRWTSHRQIRRRQLSLLWLLAYPILFLPTSAYAQQDVENKNVPPEGTTNVKQPKQPNDKAETKLGRTKFIGNPPRWIKHSVTSFDVVRSSKLQLRAHANDRAARILWFYDRRVICKKQACIFNTQKWPLGKNQLQALAVNRFGSTPLLFHITVVDGAPQNKIIQVPLATPQDQVRLVKDFPLQVSAMRGAGFFSSPNLMLILGESVQRISKKGFLRSGANSLLRIATGNKHMQIFHFLIGKSEVQIENNRPGKLRLKLLEGRVRLVHEGWTPKPNLKKQKADSSAATSTESESSNEESAKLESDTTDPSTDDSLKVEKNIGPPYSTVVEVNDFLSVILKENADIMVSFDKKNQVAEITTIRGEVDVLSRKFGQGPWDSQRFGPAHHLTAKRSGLEGYFSPPQTKLDPKQPILNLIPGDHPDLTANDDDSPDEPQEIYSAPSPAPPAYLDLLLLSKFLQVDKDNRPPLKHKEVPVPKNNEKDKKTNQKSKEESESTQQETEEIYPPWDPSKPLIYQGLPFIEPVDDIVRKLSKQLINQSVNLKLGAMNYTQTGLFSNSGLFAPILKLEHQQLTSKYWSLNIGLQNYYETQIQRLQYFSGYIGTRFHLWSEHLGGLAQLKNLEYQYSGLRPFVGAGMGIGQYIVKTALSNTSVVSTEFIAPYGELGVILYASRRWGVEFSVNFEYSVGIGPIQLSSLNLTGLLGVAYFY